MTDVERLARVLCAEFGDGFTPWDGLNALSTSTPPREAGEEAEPRLIQELRDGIGIHDNPNLRDEWGHDLLVAWSRLTRERDEARETNKRLNRRAQEAEAARGRVEFFRDMIAAQARAQVAEDRENAARAEAARLRDVVEWVKPRLFGEREPCCSEEEFIMSNCCGPCSLVWRARRALAGGQA